jgi:hypothetical protein
MPLISKAQAQKIAEEAEKRSTGGGRNNIPYGVHDLKVTEVLGKTSSAGDPMVQINYIDVDEKYDPVSEYFVIKEDGKGPEILASRLKVFNAHNFGEMETLEDLVKYVSKNLLKKTMKAAVTHEKRLYKKSETEWYVNVNVRIAYTGDVNNDMTQDASKMVKELTTVEQAEYDAYVARKNGHPEPAKRAATVSASLDDDDLGTPAPATKINSSVVPKGNAPLDMDELDKKIPAANPQSAVIGALDDDI